MVSEWFELIEGDKELTFDDKGKIHGRARCTWPHGDVYVGGFQNDKPKGRAVLLLPDGKKALLRMDGKTESKVSVAEARGTERRGEESGDPSKFLRDDLRAQARKVAKQLGLPELP